MKGTGVTALLFLCLLLAVSCGDDGTKTIPDNAQVPDESAVTDDTVTDDTVVDDTVTDDTVTDDTVADDTITDDTVIDDTVTDDTVVDNETPDDDAAPSYNFNGKWAMLNFTTSNVETDLGGILGTQKSTSTTSSYFLVELTDNGDGSVGAVGTACETLIDSGSNLLTVTISDNYIAHVKPMIWDFTTILDRGGVGFDVTASDILTLNGVKDLADPLNDPLPTDKSDTHIYDQDDDTNPGMTVNCTGNIPMVFNGPGTMYTIQRTVNTMVGESKDDMRIEGALAWESEQVVLEASNSVLLNDKTVTPDLANSWFKMVRLIDQNWTCAEIKANKDTLFPQ